MTYPLATLGPTVLATGVTIPALEDIIASLIATYETVFGADIYLGTDSQDYQILAIEAQAIFDTNTAFVAAYNSFSPQTATGTGLSSVVKINGLQRESATNSQAIVDIGGVAGTVLNNQVAMDAAGNLWSLPSKVVIPPSGTIPVTVTCQTPGAITAVAGSINQRATIVVGWQTVNNAAAAVIGASVESDGALRERQTISTASPSQTSLSSIIGELANLPGVTRSKVYENDTSAPDANGIPSHSISAVVAGGDATDIATTIQLNKDQGCGTYGSTTEIVTDPSGLPIAINFFELDELQVYVGITIQPLNGYVSTTGDAIIAAVVAYINALAIGQDVYANWINGVASLIGSSLQKTFDVTALTLGFNPAPMGTATLIMPFNAAALCATGNIVLVA
jgi:uncharacterized phage protein gp47/JayE